MKNFLCFADEETGPQKDQNLGDFVSLYCKNPGAKNQKLFFFFFFKQTKKKKICILKQPLGHSKTKSLVKYWFMPLFIK